MAAVIIRDKKKFMARHSVVVDVVVIVFSAYNVFDHTQCTNAHDFFSVIPRRVSCSCAAFSLLVMSVSLSWSKSFCQSSWKVSIFG